MQDVKRAERVGRCHWFYIHPANKKRVFPLVLNTKMNINPLELALSDEADQ
jgi:hypothetical protein